MPAWGVHFSAGVYDFLLSFPAIGIVKQDREAL